ncbi:MAG TPA: RNA polymerase sigma factor [Pyrinomonadaceae bacterium]|nr:RNA polymerase sigma factor [Pyrinomonadaceae bacterium]
MTSESPDEVLVLAAILGNLEAFEQLVLRYRPAVVRLARTVVGADYAEDVAQDALLLAFKALPSIEEPRRFAAWLSAITRNRALRFSKSEDKHVSKRVALDEALLERIEALAKPAAIRDGVENFRYRAEDFWYRTEEKEREEEMMIALDSLPADYAMPLRLHFLDDMPLKRIAAFMGVPLSTVKWRIHYGKKLMRAQIENMD